MDAAPMIPSEAEPNSFGGFKVLTEWIDGLPTEVDIWPGDIGEFLSRASNPSSAFQPASSTYILTERYDIQSE
jgi:hypothetical protein